MKPNYRPTEADLELAIENLKSAAIVGTVERYDDTLAIAQQCLRESFEDPSIDLKPVSLNTTSKKVASDEEMRQKLIDDLGEELVDRLEEMNKLDDELYQIASSVLDAKLKSLD